MQIKLPLIVSTSQYNSPAVIWAEAQNPPVAAVVCRASIGTPAWMQGDRYATDQSFKVYWPQWFASRMPRCAYHFLMNGIPGGGKEQARWFLQCVNNAGGFKSGDRICLDVEDQYRPYSLREVVDFFITVLPMTGFTPEECLIYSRKDIMDPLSFSSLSTVERNMMRRIYQYPAGYPDDPDSMSFDALVAAYHFDLQKYGPVALVQYAASAIVQGISKPGYLSVECNVAEDAYLAKWQQQTAAFYGTAPGPVDVVTTPYAGVRMTRGRRHDSDMQMVEVSKFAIDGSLSSVTPDGTCKPISAIAGDIVANGGDFNMTICEAVGLLISDGHRLREQADSEPALGLYPTGTPEISIPVKAWRNAVGLKRMLVSNGVINPTPSDAWNTREPRTIYGVKADGTLLILSVKGRQPDQAGMDLYQCARTMIEFGAIFVGDGDGGESVQARVKGEVFLGTASTRQVADFVSIVIKQGGPMAKYKCTVTWDGGANVRPEPSTSNIGVGTYPDNAVFYATDVVPDQDEPTNADKRWALVESDPINGVKFAGKFVAIKYPSSAGSERCTVEDLTLPPPPTGGSAIEYIEVVRVDGSRQRFVPQA